MLHDELKEMQQKVSDETYQIRERFTEYFKILANFPRLSNFRTVRVRIIEQPLLQFYIS